MSEPFIEFITCENGDWEVLSVDFGETFQKEGHQIMSEDWIKLLKILGYNVKKKEISDDDMEGRNY